MGYIIRICKPSDITNFSMYRKSSLLSMGEPDQVMKQISETLTKGKVDWNIPKVVTYSHPIWARYHVNDITLELDDNEQKHVLVIEIEIIGTPINPYEEAILLCKKYGWVPVENRTGKIIDLENPETRDWKAIKEYWTRVRNGSEKPEL